MRQRRLLTSRECQVLYGLAMGLSNKEIGARMYISETTVKSHMARMADAMGLPRASRALLVSVGFRDGALAWHEGQLLMGRARGRDQIDVHAALDDRCT